MSSGRTIAEVLTPSRRSNSRRHRSVTRAHQSRLALHTLYAMDFLAQVAWPVIAVGAGLLQSRRPRVPMLTTIFVVADLHDVLVLGHTGASQDLSETYAFPQTGAMPISPCCQRRARRHGPIDGAEGAAAASLCPRRELLDLGVDRATLNGLRWSRAASAAGPGARGAS